MDARLHPGLEPEVGSSLEYKYSVTRGATKAAWYSPCKRWSLGGASARSVGEKGIWVVGWVFGRGFSGCKSGNGVELGSHGEILLGR